MGEIIARRHARVALAALGEVGAGQPLNNTSLRGNVRTVSSSVGRARNPRGHAWAVEVQVACILA